MGGGIAVLNMDGTVKVEVTVRDDFNLVGVPEGLSDVKAIATGGYNVLKEDGTVVVWGYNYCCRNCCGIGVGS